MLTNTLVAHSSDTEKADFYKKTYLHLALSVLAFIGVETILLRTVPVEVIAMMFGQRYTWLLIIGVFWLASVLASRWSLSQSRSTQYFGLGFYIVLEAVIFLPLIYMAAATAGGQVIFQAAMLTIAMFAGLSIVAFTSKRDFSFLRNIMIIGGFIAIGLIVAGSIFGFDLGLWFSVGMVILASAGILYETNKLQNTYTTGQYVGASLQLFASIMLLFWYILRILMSRRS
ncbi:MULTISPECIES: Bax inhibitor-1/YccA family protein [Chryseobacterium]|uniref:FtsH-binding integral membrane protein n=1 Tax=Chryseobacterium camelliae TaxID=1265445 RepID=A0ABU0TFY8_9FLAO|nr:MULTISPECIES: Bax inhibitor-1 family protein [Chryseobacterium]MDQ1095980.1 FtsH-binding integral membrane protein [Chryseobacterium camelliae]MDR6087262.1 FtsH-binding integral membrane protein [Chryseobacterium sp. SORGH_AS_0909]MDR6131636.1 FtsH-binding integral membrane protein [Chryseobacterium sp. SORGH_AS_1175]MDT3406219.1 FtsH-binding integral membrane protein [Pseudacidovorax intermedius]